MSVWEMVVLGCLGLLCMSVCGMMWLGVWLYVSERGVGKRECLSEERKPDERILRQWNELLGYDGSIGGAEDEE